MMVDHPGALPSQALAGPPVEQIVHPPRPRRRSRRRGSRPWGTDPSGARWCSRWSPPLPWVVGAAEVDRGAQRLLEALRVRELLPPVERDGAHRLAGEGALGRRVDLAVGLPGSLAAGEVAAHAVDLGDEACAAGPPGDGVALPVADAAPGGGGLRALGDVVGDLDLAPC